MDSVQENIVSPATSSVRSKRQLKRDRYNANKRLRKAGGKPERAEGESLKPDSLASRDTSSEMTKPGVPRVRLTQTALEAESPSVPPLEEPDRLLDAHLTSFEKAKKLEVGWLSFGVLASKNRKTQLTTSGIAWSALLGALITRKFGAWAGFLAFSSLSMSSVYQLSEVDTVEACERVPGCFPELVGYLIMRYPDNTKEEQLASLTLAAKQWCSAHYDWDLVTMASRVRLSILAYQQITSFRGLGVTKNARPPSWLSVYAQKDPIWAGLGLVLRSFWSPLIAMGDVTKNLFESPGFRFLVGGLALLTATAYTTKSTVYTIEFFANVGRQILKHTKALSGQLRGLPGGLDLSFQGRMQK